MRPSEIAAGVVAVGLLLALLTWLLARSVASDSADYSMTVRIFDDFALAEASLHRDVLEARAGLLENYDPLVRSSKQIDDAVAQLRAQVASKGLDPAPVDRLAAATNTEEELTERFKSDNAILRNSLAYVGLLSTSPGFIDRNPRLAPSIGALAAAILQLTLNSSAQSHQAVQDRLLELAVQTPVEAADEGTAQALISHARLLKDLLPSVDDTLKALFAIQTEQPLWRTRIQLVDAHMAAEALAQRFRLLLYATSVLLVVALIGLGKRLRARAAALRKTAAFERLIAEHSTRLINCPPGETEARLTQALAEFARAIDADRAYVVLGTSPVRAYAWSEDEAPYLAGWPEAAFSLQDELKHVPLGVITAPDVIVAPDVARLPDSGAKQTLLAFGARAWACVVLPRQGWERGILGFDRLEPARGLFFPLAAVRLAGDAIANALEREISEREKTKLTTRLERALRMQMIGQLASGIAHNFNNIIGAIVGYSEMAAAEIKPDTKAARHVAEIERAAERGRDLVDSIRTFGRRSDARTSLVSARALIDEAASLLRVTLPPGIELVVSDVPSDLALFGESAQLQQIILNLCKNAAQAMDGSGRICIMMDRQELDRPRALTHGELPPGRYLRLVVADTGPGLSEEVARRLFEPFFTTRPAGTGLGLATVRKIVRDHGGAMNVASAPGQGSRFEAWLPAAAGSERRGATIEATAPPSLGRGETVLVIHDRPDRLLADEETVAALGYEPVGFERSADAIAAVRAEPLRFDAVLISQASVQAALDLARSLHTAAPGRPILLAARSAVDVGSDTLVRSGIVDVVRRPLISAEVAAALSRALASAATLQSPIGLDD